MNYLDGFFGRINERGNVDVLDLDGCPIESLPNSVPVVYPVGSSFGAGYMHGGVELTAEDANKINLWIEDVSKGEGPS
tara:strand:+ start:1775 stop:2008 length:234 start_codon:yes stop_codon:yes gene_type:complete